YNKKVSDSKDASKKASSHKSKNHASETDNIKDFKEYKTLKSELNLGKLKASVKTNNPGTRVTLFSKNNGQKVAKSVYVKHDNRLKIIEFGHGQVFNQRI